MGGSYQRRHSIDGDEDSGAVGFNMACDQLASSSRVVCHL
jgi:hypothetical protein